MVVLVPPRTSMDATRTSLASTPAGALITRVVAAALPAELALLKVIAADACCATSKPPQIPAAARRRSQTTKLAENEIAGSH